MFSIKRIDGHPAQFTAYATRELKDLCEEYRLQFLIFDTRRNEWAWVYAKDWMPV